MAWVQVFLGMTGVCLAFLIPSVIFVAVIIAAKIKPTPLVIATGLGMVTFVGVLILLPMDPRIRQYSRLHIVFIALFLGLLGFLGPLVIRNLQSVLGLPHSKMWRKDRESLLATGRNELQDGRDADKTEAKIAEDDGPSG